MSKWLKVQGDFTFKSIDKNKDFAELVKQFSGSQRLFKNWLLSNSIFGVYRGGVLVGHVVIRSQDVGVFIIRRYYVRSDMLGLGLCDFMFNATVEQIAIFAGVCGIKTGVELKVIMPPREWNNFAAQSLYRKDFNEIQDDYNSPHLSRIFEWSVSKET